MVRYYSAGGLSFRSERLIAIAALARRMYDHRRALLGVHVAGLWTNMLSPGLLWPILTSTQKLLRQANFFAGKGGPLPKPTYYAPSWSWESTNEPVDYRSTLVHTVESAQAGSIEDIRFATRRQSEREPTWHFDIVRCEVVPVDQNNRFGAV